jgi:hypothetical protein
MSDTIACARDKTSAVLEIAEVVERAKEVDAEAGTRRVGTEVVCWNRPGQYHFVPVSQELHQ